VRVNPYSIEEVIVNLLNNARDAVEKRTREEGASYTPSIRIATGSKTQNARDVAWLKVQDNGVGIPPGIVDKVFDPFFTTKDPDKGTGLGLAICRSIIEEFSGSIQFTSEKTEGTIFTICFPSHINREEEKGGYVQSTKCTNCR
jgi:signal transduction histidine kinase